MMAKISIDGITMPKDCWDCRFRTGFICPIIEKNVGGCVNFRHRNCPITSTTDEEEDAE